MMPMPRPILLWLLMPPLLAGCSTLKNPLQGAFTNRVVVTVAEDECLSASRWGFIAITGDVDKRDCTVIVQALRLRQLVLNAAAARGAAASEGH